MVTHHVLPLGTVGLGCRAGQGLPSSPRLSPTSLAPPPSTSGKMGRMWYLFSTRARSLTRALQGQPGGPAGTHSLGGQPRPWSQGFLLLL